MELPRGFKFNPSDDDCIFYLTEKIFGNPLPFQGMILELNPYDEAQLPDILAAADRKDLYIFTKLRRKGTNVGKNVERKVGEGTWHVDSTKKIRDEHGSLIGISRVLSYWEQNGSTSTNHKRCLMTEYLLHPHDNNYNMFKDWVLCRLVKNDRWKNGKKVVGRSANYSAAANSPSEEVDQATPSELPPEQTLAASGIMNGLVPYENGGGPTAANSGFPLEADDYYPYTREVDQAMLINNLPVSVAVEIPPTQALVAFEHGDNQLMAYNYNSYTYCEVTEAPLINNVLPLEYSMTTAAVEIPHLQTPVDVQVLDYNSYTQVEATPSSVNDLQAELSTAVEIPLPQSYVDFVDGNDELDSALMAMDFEDQTKLFDWTMDPFVGEECWKTSGLWT